MALRWLISNSQMMVWESLVYMKLPVSATRYRKTQTDKVSVINYQSEIHVDPKRICRSPGSVPVLHQ